MQRSALVPVSIVLVLAALGAWGFFAWRDAVEVREREEAEAREEAEQELARLRAELARLRSDPKRSR